MTGNYPHHTAVNSVLDTALSLDDLELLMSDEKIISEYFKESGYRTRLIGKWSLGFYQEKNSQKHRGFDSFFGYLDPLGIYNYTNVSEDFAQTDNEQIVNDVTQMYATEMFTREAIKVIKSHDKSVPLYLQINHLEVHAATGFHPTRAKPEDVDKFLYIENPKRKHLAGERIFWEIFKGWNSKTHQLNIFTKIKGKKIFNSILGAGNLYKKITKIERRVWNRLSTPCH